MDDHNNITQELLINNLCQNLKNQRKEQQQKQHHRHYKNNNNNNRSSCNNNKSLLSSPSSSIISTTTTTTLSSSSSSTTSSPSLISCSSNLSTNISCSCNLTCFCCFHRNYLIKKMESEFYKFLARFSGRRRSLIEGFCKFISNFIFILIVISLISNTEACSSRTTPKPRPPPTPAPRPNITFHTYKCPPNYAKWYCLNEATCFTVKIGDEILYNCECADGYMGPRCEYKDLDGSYLPTRPRVMLETASIASGATLALIFVFILGIIMYLRWQQRKKIDTFSENGVNIGVGGGGGRGGGGRGIGRGIESGNGANTIDGIDTIDGSGSGPGGGGSDVEPGGASSRVISYVRCEHLERRPFGPHHNYTIPMAATIKR